MTDKMTDEVNAIIKRQPDSGEDVVEALEPNIKLTDIIRGGTTA